MISTMRAAAIYIRPNNGIFLSRQNFLGAIYFFVTQKGDDGHIQNLAGRLQYLTLYESTLWPIICQNTGFSMRPISPAFWKPGHRKKFYSRFIWLREFSSDSRRCRLLSTHAPRLFDAFRDKRNAISRETHYAPMSFQH